MKKTIIMLSILVLLVGCNKPDYESAYEVSNAQFAQCNAALQIANAVVETNDTCPVVNTTCNAAEVMDLIRYNETTDLSCMLKLEKVEKQLELFESMNNSINCMNTADDLNNCELKLNRTEAKLKEIEDLI